MDSNNQQYWFKTYDLESFEKDFQRVSYMNYIYQVTSDPYFKFLNEENISDRMNADQNKEVDPEWQLFLKVIYGYLDCEKLYYIMFWPINYIKEFISKRIFASFVRLYKFLISLQINVIICQPARQSERLRQVLQRAQQQQLYVDKTELKQLIENILDQIQIVENIIKRNNTDDKMNHELKMIQKIHNYCKHFFDQSCFDLKNESDRQSQKAEINIMSDILIHNDKSVKQLDYYLEKGNLDYKESLKKEQVQYQNSEQLQAIIDLSEQTFKAEAEEKKEELKKLNLNKKKKKRNPNQVATSGYDQRDFQTGQTLSTEANDDYSEETIYDQQGEGSNKLIEALKGGIQETQPSGAPIIRKLADAKHFNNSPNHPKNAQNSFLRDYVQDIFQDQAKNVSKEKMKRGGESVNEIKMAFVKDREKGKAVQQLPFQSSPINKQQYSSNVQLNSSSVNSSSSNNDKDDDDSNSEDQQAIDKGDNNILQNTMPYYQQQEQYVQKNVQYELLNGQITTDIIHYILDQDDSIAQIKKEDLENYKKWLLSQEAQNNITRLPEPTENKNDQNQDNENDNDESKQIQISNQTYKKKQTNINQTDNNRETLQKREIVISDNDKLTYKRVDEKPSNEVKDEDIFCKFIFVDTNFNFKIQLKQEYSFEEEEQEEIEDGSNQDDLDEDDLNKSQVNILNQIKKEDETKKKVEKKDKVKIPFTGFQGNYENSFRYFMNEKIFFDLEKDGPQYTQNLWLQQDKKKLNGTSLNPLQSRWEMLQDFFINKSRTYKNIENQIKNGRIIKIKDPNQINQQKDKDKGGKQSLQTNKLQQQKSLQEDDFSNFPQQIQRSTKYFQKEYPSICNLNIEYIFFDQHIQL